MIAKPFIRILWTTAWGYMICNSAGGQIGAGMGLKVEALHPKAQRVVACRCGNHGFVEVPPDMDTPSLGRTCPTCTRK